MLNKMRDPWNMFFLRMGHFTSMDLIFLSTVRLIPIVSWDVLMPIRGPK